MATALISDEPALSFWLRYAEREGALVERQRDHALVLLPSPLQQESELAEEVTVTGHPDIAREDGAALLIAGHPAVERAARSVLAEGDAGNAYLPWPASRAPSRSVLESRAREQISIEHGRIDASGEPIAAYLPLLKVGAIVSYAASLTLRFQEQEEIWVDAQTGLAPSERLLSAVRHRPVLPQADNTGRQLAANLSCAIPAAHRLLELKAADRERSLVAHAKRALNAELARADAYYEATLEAIARRRANAPADRARLLDAQAEATRAERTRRQREIEHEYRPQHEVRPFRLHLIHVPAFVLPVDVRRGNRVFGFALTWVAGAAEFAAVRCPACGAAKPLLASREHLGCGGCTPGAKTPGPAVPAPTVKTVEPVAKPPSPPAAPITKASRTAAAAPRPRPAAARGQPRTQPAKRTGIEPIGNKLALAFWQCVANGDRWPRQKAARDSPLRAVYRLYGNAGPQCAIGIAPDRKLDEIVASTYPTEPGYPELTVGTVTARGERYKFTLSWSLQAGKPVLGEVLPAANPLALPPVRGADEGLGLRLRERAPTPAIEFDPVAAQLWTAELAQSGLPFAIRCLATWWRLQSRGETPWPSEAIAAAVAAAVARAARTRRTRDETARLYPIELELFESVQHELQAELRLDRTRGW